MVCVMKCGISTACFYPEIVEETILKIKELEMNSIEIFINTESEFDMPYVKDLRSRLDEAGIRAISVHPFTSLMEGVLFFSEYDRRIEDGLRQYERYFKAAHMLGAKYFTFHGERSMSSTIHVPDADRKLRTYHRLCALAQQHDVVLAQENVAWCKSASPAYLQWLRDGVQELRFTLDIKQAHRAGCNWNEYLTVMGERLVNVHINDFDDTHTCMLPGEGTMPFDALLAQLDATGYNGQLLIEVYHTDYSDMAQIERARMFLQNLITRKQQRDSI